MLIPRFSLRRLLAFVMLAALFSLLLSLAVGGNLGALAVVIAVGSVPLTLAFFGGTFFVGWVMSRLLKLHPSTDRGSHPFATSEPPSAGPPSTV
jgi:hypothetical protein